MTRLDDLRFRLLLDAAKQAIYAVDGLLALGRRRFEPPSAGRPVRIPRQRPGNPASTLAAWLVQPSTPPAAAVLILHGIGDRIEYWRQAQVHLARNGITSLIFHYSGYADSGGSTTPGELEADVRTAYQHLRTLLPLDLPIHLLGFSLGTGLAVSALHTLQPPPAGLILAEAYTSLRQAAARMGRQAGFLSVLIPDVWRSVEAIALIQVPILLIHSHGDTLFPVSMAEALHQAASTGPVEPTLILLDHFSHNAVYVHVPPAYWTPIVTFLRNSPVKR